MKIVAGEMLSIDGVVEAVTEWGGPFFDDELGRFMDKENAERDMIIMGRRTFQEMASAWQSQGDATPVAAAMNNTPKLVVSSTLTSVDEWQNSTLIAGDVATALRDLKSRDGTYAMIIGSITLVRSLLGSDVIDELMLLVFPVVAGKGKRLFDDSVSRLPLELVAEEAFPKGVVKLIYKPRRS